MIYILFILGSLWLPCIIESGNPNQSVENYILCRNCGINITSTGEIVSKRSLASSFSFTDTVFNDGEVLIQVLSKDTFVFPLITSLHSTCAGIGEWQEDELWYPGYHWKLCLCPECGAFLGWIFKSADTHAPKLITFYGLILTNIISESCKY